MIIPIYGIGELGVVADLDPTEIPLKAWTFAQNVRFSNSRAIKFQGHTDVFTSPNIAPYWLLPVQRKTDHFWIYAGLAKLSATDGSSHADITRASGGDYTVDAANGWTGTIIEGIPVVNQPGDVPQSWVPSLSNDMTNLANWTSTHRAGAMCSLKRYLVALDITKSSTRYPTMIKWSGEAPTAGVPLTWDETDETNDAGEWVLSDIGGFLVNGIPLRDQLILYKEAQTWLMTYVGGVEVFRFNRKFTQVGMVAKHAAVEFLPGKHIVLTGDDVVIHDGQEAQSIIDQRSRTLLDVDPTNFARSFVVSNPLKSEAWVCFPTTGMTLPNRALIWNWKTQTIGARDLPNTAYITHGIINYVPSSDAWSGDSQAWDLDTTLWGDRPFNPAQKSLLMALPETTKLMQADQTNAFNGTPFNAVLEKKAMGLPLKVNGPPDFSRMKQATWIYPRVQGTVGRILNFYFAAHEYNVDPVYGAARPYVIGSSDSIDTSDVPPSRLHAIRIESDGDFEWSLSGFDIDVVDRGDA